MKELFLKDLSLCSGIVILGLVFLFAPFAVGVAAAVYYSDGPVGENLQVWASCLQYASGAVGGLSLLTFLFLGAHVVADERQHRTSEFLAYLPPSRHKILASKLLLCLAFVVVIWSVFLIGIEVASQKFGGDMNESMQMAYYIMLMGFTILGVSWLASCVLESPPRAMIIGFVVPLAAMMGVPMTLQRLAPGISSRTSTQIFCGSLLSLGLGGFVLGWWLYVRRVEP